MNKVELKWLTISEYRKIDKSINNCTIVSFPLPSDKGLYIIGVYFYNKRDQK